MENKLSKTEQLDMLVKHFASGNKAKFARMLGITKQSLNTWYNRELLSVEKVYSAFPEVSAEWLLAGQGAMLRIDNATGEEPEETNQEKSAASETIRQEPALRCTTIFGNTAVIKLSNIEEMTYNAQARLVQIFTHRQHLIIAMSSEEFEKLYQATTSLRLPAQQ